MESDIKILVFELHGTAPTSTDRLASTIAATEENADNKLRLDMLKHDLAASRERDEGLADQLNAKSDELSAAIERDLRRVLFSATGVSPQVELSFRTGESLVLEGMVFLIGFAGSIVLDAVRAELGEVLKVAVRRRLNAALASMPNRQQIARPLTVDVFETSPRRSSAAPSLAQGGGGAARRQGAPMEPRMTLIWLSMLTLVVALLLASQFVTVSLRPAPTPAALLHGAADPPPALHGAAAAPALMSVPPT